MKKREEKAGEYRRREKTQKEQGKKTAPHPKAAVNTKGAPAAYAEAEKEEKGERAESKGQKI